jgi:hypothetical protein
MMAEKKEERRDGAPKEERKSSVPLPGRWSEVMDELIEEAMRAGAFDDLPGHGKPLKLIKNPYAPGTELAYQLLKDNNYTLPWIAERQVILEEIEKLRAEIGRLWRRYQAEYQPARSEFVRQSLSLGWESHLESWQERIVKINKQIADLNLKQPGEQLEILKLTLENELARVGASHQLA